MLSTTGTCEGSIPCGTEACATRRYTCCRRGQPRAKSLRGFHSSSPIDARRIERVAGADERGAVGTERSSDVDALALGYSLHAESLCVGLSRDEAALEDSRKKVARRAVLDQRPSRQSGRERLTRRVARRLRLAHLSWPRLSFRHETFWTALSPFRGQPPRNVAIGQRCGEDQESKPHFTRLLLP